MISPVATLSRHLDPLAAALWHLQRYPRSYAAAHPSRVTLPLDRQRKSRTKVLLGSASRSVVRFAAGSTSASVAVVVVKGAVWISKKMIV